MCSHAFSICTMRGMIRYSLCSRLILLTCSFELIWLDLSAYFSYFGLIGLIGLSGLNLSGLDLSDLFCLFFGFTFSDLFCSSFARVSQYFAQVLLTCLSILLTCFWMDCILSGYNGLFDINNSIMCIICLTWRIRTSRQLVVQYSTLETYLINLC